MDNLQKSELIIAALLTRLMENGIQPVEISSDSFNLSEDEKPFLRACLKWLIDEGMIRVDYILEDENDGFSMLDPQITSRGFEMLGRQLELNGVKKSLGDAVQEISRDGRSFTQFGDFVGGILGGFTKSVSS